VAVVLAITQFVAHTKYAGLEIRYVRLLSAGTGCVNLKLNYNGTQSQYPSSILAPIGASV
jgi:hypothetical protein